MTYKSSPIGNQIGKVITASVFLITFILPLTSHAATTYPPKCINYGYSKYDNPTVDFPKLKTAGFTCLRLAFKAPGDASKRALALQAKQAGFYVVMGNDNDAHTVTTTYRDAVVAEAKWAQANKIDQMSIANEFQHTWTTKHALAGLSCRVRAVYSGKISYDTYKPDSGFNDIQAWHEDLACLDYLGLNIYADHYNTAKQAQTLLKDHWYISEFNIDMDYYKTVSDKDHASMLSTVISDQFLGTFNVKKYYFAYGSSGTQAPMHWGLYQNGKLAQPLTAAVLNIK